MKSKGSTPCWAFFTSSHPTHLYYHDFFPCLYSSFRKSIETTTRETECSLQNTTQIAALGTEE